MIVWGSRHKAVDLGPVGNRFCGNCGLERPFRVALYYQLHHLYYVVGFVSHVNPWRLCRVCGHGEVMPAPTAEIELSAAGTAAPRPFRVAIPWYDRFGLLAAAGAAAALILFGVALRLSGPEPRNIPDLVDRARHGDAAALARLHAEAQADDEPSQEALMDLYQAGQGVQHDDAQAFTWARRSAEHGNARAQHALAAMYEHGDGTAADPVQALHWYRQAAARKLPASANSLGALYLRGVGVEADPIEAVRWFRQAAEAGDPPGCFNLAMRYLAGQGVAQDEVEARRWLEQAASTPRDDEQARVVVAAAKLELGRLYEDGTGVEKHMVKALHYYEEASPRNEEARESFERLAARLAAESP